DGGTDVNFGNITRKLINYLQEKTNTNVYYNSKVVDIKQLKDKRWKIKAINQKKNRIDYFTADFLFIGAGGNSIPLLHKAKIKESKKIGGFPISGEFLYCDIPEIVNKHQAKVYSKEPVGEPPMTVPHLDKRHINGKEVLLFGPFAGFGPKFLKYGSNTDFIKSVKLNNIITMILAGFKNIPLIRYSIKQVLMSKDDKIEVLKEFVPSARNDEWKLITAGKRVQIIKNKGNIHFGTDIVKSDDNTFAALLGESPGASTSVSIMINVLKNNFPKEFKRWEEKLEQMMPSFNKNVSNDRELLEKVDNFTKYYLQL